MLEAARRYADGELVGVGVGADFGIEPYTGGRAEPWIVEKAAEIAMACESAEHLDAGRVTRTCMTWWCSRSAGIDVLRLVALQPSWPTEQGTV